MTADRDPAELIGELYEAATGGEDWLAVSASLNGLIGADSATLSVRQADGSLHNLLRPLDIGEVTYVTEYRHIDPLRNAATLGRRLGDPKTVFLARELVPEPRYMRSEFYQGYARPAGQRYSLLGVVEERQASLLAFFRAETLHPFADREKGLIGGLMPHMQRSLQLQRRLAVERAANDHRFAALARANVPVIVVDAGMHVLFANEAGLNSVMQPRSGLSIARAGPRSDADSTVLVAKHRDDDATLRALVLDAVAMRPGGAMRLRASETENDVLPSVAVLVSPAPTRVTTRPGTAAPGLVEGFAMVLLRDLSAPVLPPQSLFSDLFGLSAAEAAVAVALLGGRTAEEVARLRNVSLDTVRTQIRTVLSKTEATNLRDFERIGAMLASMAQ